MFITDRVMRSGQRLKRHTISNLTAVSLIKKELQRELRQIIVVGDGQLVAFLRVRLESQVGDILGQYRTKRQGKTAGELCIVQRPSQQWTGVNLCPKYYG